MKKLLEKAKKTYPNGKYYCNKEDNTVTIVLDKGKYVILMYYKDNLICENCLFEPIDWKEKRMVIKPS